MWSLRSFPGFRYPLEAGKTDHGSPRVQNKCLSCVFGTLTCEEPQIPLYLTMAQPLPALSSKPLASGWGCCPTPPCRSSRASSRVNPTSILYAPVFHFRGPAVCLPLLFPKTGSNPCHQTVLHVTEKFEKRRANWHSKVHCCLILRNCHSHPNLQQVLP